VSARGQVRRATDAPKRPPSVPFPRRSVAGEKRGTRAENASSICFRKEEVDEAICRHLSPRMLRLVESMQAVFCFNALVRPNAPTT